MELKTLGKKVKGLTDGGEDRGVSPVIGVILMVAITVILAAVIGAFVLGLGDDLDSSAAPNAAISPSGEVTHDGTSFTAADVVIEHTQGDTVAIDEMRVIVRDNGTNIGVIEGADLDESGDFSVGDTLQFADSSTNNETTLLNLLNAETGTEYEGNAGADGSSALSIELVHSPSGTQIGGGEISITTP